MLKVKYKAEHRYRPIPVVIALCIYVGQFSGENRWKMKIIAILYPTSVALS